MPDNNAAIIVALIVVLFVVAFAAYQARKWIKEFTSAIVQAKAAEREENVV